MRRRSRTPPEPPEDSSSAEAADGAPRGDAERLAGYRLVRRIATGERADVYLAAVVDRSAQAADEPVAAATGEHRGLVALRVYDADADAEAITTEVEAMAIAASLPALLDLATLADGRTCVVVERLAGPTLAAIAVGSGLTPGEAVTVLAPILVAVHELERLGFAHVRLALSDVMFDGSGRPRLIGAGGLRRLDATSADPAARTALVREMYAALARLVDDVAAITRPPGALDPVRHLLGELLAVRPFRTHADELERMLFAVAAPAPVAVGTTSAVRAGGSRRHRSVDAPPEPTTAGVGQRSGPPSRWLPRSLSSFDAMIHESLTDDEPARAGSSRVAALRARLRRAVAGRRPVLIVGALAGGASLVLALTLVPPAADSSTAVLEGEPMLESEPAIDGEPARKVESAHEGESPPRGAGAGVPSTETDAAAAAVTLLGLREGCFTERDAACLDDVLQPGSGLESADRARMVGDPAAEDSEPRPEFAFEGARVVGEMGGAWLVEVPYREPERPPASVLVMRSEAGWRLREIFG